MFSKLVDSRSKFSLATHMRRRRMAFFISLLEKLPPPLTILDVGGTQNFWQMMDIDGISPDHWQVTLLNLSIEPVSLPGITSLAGDARKMSQFSDASFDVVFSNSVIEHVGDDASQKAMAREICRVGKRHFIQTPNRYFPLEPHFLVPFFQFFPISVRARLLTKINLGWIKRVPEYVQARELVESVRLLKYDQFQSLFPGSEIYREKFLGLDKSFIAYGGWS